MRIDRSTKLLLGAIALGLWANALAPFFRPAPVHAQDASSIQSSLDSIEHDVHSIYSGTCLGKICNSD
jgi:hypothetical protein